METAMNAEELFQAEWQVLEDQRKSLIEKLSLLNARFKNIRGEKSVRELLEQKDRLEKQRRELCIDLWCFKFIAKNTDPRFIQIRQREIKDPKLQRDFDGDTKRITRRIEHLQKTGGPAFVIDQYKKVLWELNASISKVEKVFEAHKAERQECIRLLESMVAEIDQSIADLGIGKHLKDTKACLHRLIDDIQERQCLLKQTTVKWASRDRTHLQWAKQHGFLYIEEAIAQHALEHPCEDLSALLPPTNSLAPSLQKPRRFRQREARPVTEAVPDQSQNHFQPWKFEVLIGSKSYLLPHRRGKFIKTLKCCLNKDASCRSVNCDSVHRELTNIASMDEKGRGSLEPVSYGDFQACEKLGGGKKCKKRRVGDYRLLLDISEPERKIRFIVKLRRDVYD